jgi:hypothetical protein
MRIDRDKFLFAVAAVGVAYGFPSSSSAQPSMPGATSDDAEPAADTGASCRGKPAGRPAACNDLSGAPGDCRKADCRRTPFICQHCEDYKAYFKPKIAERAVACVVAQSGAQLQDGCRTYQCGDEALGSACIDPLADPACWVVSRSCNASMDECRALLSGMNDAGLQKIVACAMSGCRYGLWSCVEGL